MDELLFISMAKLGADRLKEERMKRGDAPVAIPRPVKVAPPVIAGQPTPEASRLAAFSLAFALGLAGLALGIGIAATLEHAPAGEVVVREVDAAGNLPGEFKLSQAATARDMPVISRPSFSMARSMVGVHGKPQLRRM